jgi:hypothetical protein
MKPWLLALVLTTTVMTVLQGGEPRVSIQVSRDAKTIVCRVPQHPDNRALFIGIADQLNSQRQLDGAEAAITHRLTLPRLVDCQTEEPFEHAFCEVIYLDGGKVKHEIAHTPILCRSLP